MRHHLNQEMLKWEIHKSRLVNIVILYTQYNSRTCNLNLSQVAQNFRKSQSVAIIVNHSILMEVYLLIDYLLIIKVLNIKEITQFQEIIKLCHYPHFPKLVKESCNKV